MIEEQIKTFFEDEIELEIRSVSFNFVRNSVFQDIPVKEGVVDPILSIYSFSVDKEKISESNLKMSIKNEIIASKLQAIKVVNPIIVITPV